MCSGGMQGNEQKPLRCGICGRISNTGQHYGVTACLGCKTFFRRVVLQSADLVCKFDGNCKLVKGGLTKRICRKCRFDKCKEQGMREDALHPCRDLIGKRKDSTSFSDSSDTSSHISFHPGLPQHDELLDLLEHLSAIDEEVDRDQRASTSSSCLRLNGDVTSSIRKELVRMRLWAHRIPGFDELSSTSKRHLIHRFCLMFFILEQSAFTAKSSQHNDLWLFTDGTCLARDLSRIPEELREGITSRIENEQKLLCPLTSLVLDDVVEPMRRIQPCEKEIAALKVLMLMKPTILENVCTQEDRNILMSTRNKMLRGLHAVNAMKPDIAIRISSVLMLCGPVEISASLGMEHMHMLRFFDVGSFDEEMEHVVFGLNTNTIP